MPWFQISLVKAGDERLFAEYHQAEKPSEAAQKAAAEGRLSKEVSIKARSKEDAIRKAEDQNPGYKAIRWNISRGLM